MSEEESVKSWTTTGGGSASRVIPFCSSLDGDFVDLMSEMSEENVKSSTIGGSASGVTPFCSSLNGDLSAKKCDTCYAKDLGPMTQESAQPLLQQIPGWNLVTDNGILKLQRSWKTKSFTKGLDFLKLVGDVAESEDHHPDLHLVRWNNVKIDIWTYGTGGLTENDFILAAKINQLHVEDLMRIEKTPSEITWSSAP